jgi:hypothetical protein
MVVLEIFEGKLVVDKLTIGSWVVELLYKGVGVSG